MDALHDVSEFKTELRAHQQVLQALRETQLEQAQETARGFATVLAAVEAIADRLPDGPDRLPDGPGDQARL
jgi:hypothetical protein